MTPSVLNVARSYLTSYVNSSGATVFVNSFFKPGVDTNSSLPVLAVNGTPTATATDSHYIRIFSLVTTTPTTYGSQLGSTINLTNTGPGGYVPGFTVLLASNKGYGVITGFHAPDAEIYALDVLSASSGSLTTAQLNAAITDINASYGGVTASPVTGVYLTVFEGCDVLWASTSPAVTGVTSYLGIDFSVTGDSDSMMQGLTVGAIPAVPEPAPIALAVIGGAGVILGRRAKFPILR